MTEWKFSLPSAAIAVGLLFGPTGCGYIPREPRRMYEGPEKPIGEVAILRSSLGICEIDGEWVFEEDQAVAPKDEYHLDPGMHEVLAGDCKPYGAGVLDILTAFSDIEFVKHRWQYDYQAGHVYEFELIPIWNWETGHQFVDTTTGEVIMRRVD